MNSMERQKQDWEGLAQRDPFWAVLSDRTKKGGNWDEAEFWATGQERIDAVLLELAGAGWGPPGQDGHALDFGCGVGRLTQPLTAYFSSVTGVDVADEMIRLASDYHSGTRGLVFRQDSTGSLTGFADSSFDFVLSLLVLQHQSSTESLLGYLHELCRVLRPSGALVFDVPTGSARRLPRWGLRRHLFVAGRSCKLPASFLQTRLGLNPMHMVSVTEEEVTDVLGTHGMRHLLVTRKSTGRVNKSTFYACKPA